MRLQGIGLVYENKKEGQFLFLFFAIRFMRKGERCGKGGEGGGRGEGQNDIKSFGIGRVVVKEMGTTQGGISYMSRRGEEGGLAS